MNLLIANNYTNRRKMSRKDYIQTALLVKATAGYNPDKTWVVSEAPDVEMAAESTDDQQ